MLEIALKTLASAAFVWAVTGIFADRYNCREDRRRAFAVHGMAWKAALGVMAVSAVIAVWTAPWGGQ